MQTIDELVAQRKLLKEAEKAAKASGRSADWYLARPESQRYVGLTNQGATCYLNSLVQGLYVCPELRESLYSFEYDPVLHGAEDSCVPLQLGRLFAELQLSTRWASLAACCLLLAACCLLLAACYLQLATYY